MEVGHLEFVYCSENSLETTGPSQKIPKILNNILKLEQILPNGVVNIDNMLGGGSL